MRVAFGHFEMQPETGEMQPELQENPRKGLQVAFGLHFIFTKRNPRKRLYINKKYSLVAFVAGVSNCTRIEICISDITRHKPIENIYTPLIGNYLQQMQPQLLTKTI